MRPHKREWVHLSSKTVIEREKLTMQKRDKPCRNKVHTWTKGVAQVEGQTQRGAGMAQPLAAGRQAEQGCGCQSRGTFGTGSLRNLCGCFCSLGS